MGDTGVLSGLLFDLAQKCNNSGITEFSIDGDYFIVSLKTDNE